MRTLPMLFAENYGIENLQSILPIEFYYIENGESWRTEGKLVDKYDAGINLPDWKK